MNGTASHARGAMGTRAWLPFLSILAIGAFCGGCYAGMRCDFGWSEADQGSYCRGKSHALALPLLGGQPALFMSLPQF